MNFEQEDNTIIIDASHIFDFEDHNGEIGWENQGTTTVPKPKIEIIETSYERNTIKITITTKRNDGGTLEIYVKEEGQTEYTKQQTITNASIIENDTIENVDVAKTYQIKVVATALNGEKTEKVIEAIRVPNLTEKNTIFSYTNKAGNPIPHDTWTKGTVIVKVSTKNINMTGYVLETSKDGITWKAQDSQIFEENGIIYVRLKDTNTGQVGKEYIRPIQNIDVKEPAVFTPVVKDTEITTNSIIIKGMTTDQVEVDGTAGSGIEKYYFRKGTNIKDQITWEAWEPLGGITASEGENASYTFSGLTHNKVYCLQMKAVDKVGHEKESEIITKCTQEVPSGSDSIGMNGLVKSDIEIEYGMADWTKNEVEVTLINSTGNNSYKLQYQKCNVELTDYNVNKWKDYEEDKPIKFTDNGKILARLIDPVGNTGNIVTGNVMKIDTILPAEFTPTVANGEVELKDADPSIKDAWGFGTFEQDESYRNHIVTATIRGETYTGDQFVNYRTESIGKVILYIDYNVSKGVGYYGLDYDYTGTEHADWIGSEAWKYLGESMKVTSNAMVVSAEVTDPKDENGLCSEIAKYQFSKDNGQSWELNDSQVSASYTFEGLTPGKTYSFKMKAIDGAGNERISEPRSKTVPVKADDIANSSNIGEYYGAKVVGYECPNGEAVANWKIYYADKRNIYLIASNYITSKYVPKGKGGSSVRVSEDMDYKFSFVDVKEDYKGSEDITESKIQQLNGDYFKFLENNDLTSTEPNIKSIAYLLDTNVWNGFKGDKAEYAIGGTTVEMLLKSYSQKHKVDFRAKATSVYGYQVSRDGGNTWENYASGMLQIRDDLYFIGGDFYLASPHAAGKNSIFSVTEGASVSDVFCNENGSQSLRPVICLNSNVYLEKTADGVYTIKE